MCKKKDILFLCQYFYPEYISSATLPFDTALRLKEEGYSVDVLCGVPKEYSNQNEVPLKEEYQGIKIQRINYVQLNRKKFLGRIINYFSFTISVLIRFLKLRRYKSIIVYSNPPIIPVIASMANYIFKVKVVYVCYDVYPEIALRTNSISEKSAITKIMKVCNKVIFKNIDVIVALSNEMRDFILNNRNMKQKTQIKVIPNWYKDEIKNNSDHGIENKIFNFDKNEKKLVISYFGNLGTAQDIDTIIKAIEYFNSDTTIQFLFAVHGNKVEQLRKFVEDKQIKNVQILSFLHNKDFEDALQISDCFVVSLAEGLTGLAVPSKTYSYMVAGKPIIAIMDKSTDIAKDLIENEAGFAIEVNNSKKLISSIIDLRDNIEKRKIMGNNCRGVFLKKYTTEQCTGQYVTLMQNLLEGR
ncbi:glycosyltransferase family 4 protein [Virgibacillus pantothenticus]|uniref:glycosyltransferase family 4 protein n=1 Tax=Virgibacillus pantothenticus TaxID=1473 RepID=UPI00098568B9|nr:glycosyltransferase family 4 protein [Virgibacillus pantothenticus]